MLIKYLKVNNVKIIFFTLLCMLIIPSDSFASVKLLPPQDNYIYFGAYTDFGGSEDMVSDNAILEYENLAGKNIVWAYFSQNWMDGIVYPIENINIIHNHGAIPFIRLMPRSNYGTNEPTYTLENIIRGDFDNDIRKWAQDAKVNNIPLLMDFAVEMTGDWFSWCGVYNGGNTKNGYGNPNYFDGPERYRDAYRHIIDIFNEENVTNITWFFHPDITREPNEEWNSPKYYYPGDEYIDWIGVSIYGAQIPKASESWDSFEEVLISGYQLINDIDTNNPIALLEFGVTDEHPSGDKSQWLEEAFSVILDNPYIDFKAISYWHENWENDSPDPDSKLRIDSSSEVLTKFKLLVDNDRLTSNAFFSDYSTRADVNQDNIVNSIDAMLVLRHFLNIDMIGTNWLESEVTGDVNCDNISNYIDVQLLLRYSLGFNMGETDWCI